MLLDLKLGSMDRYVLTCSVNPTYSVDMTTEPGEKTPSRIPFWRLILDLKVVTDEIVTLGVSLFVLGFAFGPLIWAPLSETFGRRNIFIMTYALLTAFSAGATGSQNIQTLVILRFLAGFFGSSPFGNSGGTIADMFPSAQRGIATSTYSAAAFLGPTLGMFVRIPPG